VDIAERSLAESPFLDPTTAVQALDRLHDCLRQLVRRELSDGRLTDEAGRLRVTIPVMGWDGFVGLAFDEIRLVGAGSPQVARRLREILTDLISVAPPDRRPSLERQQVLLDATVARRYEEAADQDVAGRPDRLGIGPALTAAGRSDGGR